jgi:hypothetical protein
MASQPRPTRILSMLAGYRMDFGAILTDTIVAREGPICRTVQLASFIEFEIVGTSGSTGTGSVEVLQGRGRCDAFQQEIRRTRSRRVPDHIELRATACVRR